MALQERQAELQAQQAESMKVQTERTAPREDPNYKVVSFSMKPSGEQWAADLKCDIYFGPMHLNKTPLTKEEVDALNTLQPVEKATIVKMDGSVQLLTVRAKEDAVGRVERLTIETALRKEDNPQFLPGMVSICEQLTRQYPVAA